MNQLNISNFYLYITTTSIYFQYLIISPESQFYILHPFKRKGKSFLSLNVVAIPHNYVIIKIRIADTILIKKSLGTYSWVGAFIILPSIYWRLYVFKISLNSSRPSVVLWLPG